VKDLVELTIDKVVTGGDGIGRYGETVVFVPFSAPGDRLKVRVNVRKRNYWQGRIDEIIVPSPLRTRPPCPYYGVCGGCDLQHLSYESQLVVKKLMVNDALQRIGKVYVPLGNPIHVEPAWRYRNKSTYPVAGPPWRIGFYQRRTHRIVDIAQCLIQPEVMDRLRAAVKARLEESGETGYDETASSGNLRHLVLRRGFATGQTSLMFVTATGELASGVSVGLQQGLAELVGVIHCVNSARTNRVVGGELRLLHGSSSYREQVLGKTLQVSADSFFQANTPATELLIKRVLKYLEPDGAMQVLDLYCGVGTMTVPIADFVGNITGVETSATAVLDAEENIRANQIRNAAVVQATAEEAIGRFSRADAVILDPPRKGCSPELLAGLVRLRPRIIVYVSCSPPTLARDLALLHASGYDAVEIQPVDMFPQTSHIETITKLILSKSPAS
jgi:23S rRNA (uracil1939-C5)-methyltransferase